ncbi:MAG: radical SAM protein [Candidatus Paceibacterota bacterium]
MTINNILTQKFSLNPETFLVKGAKRGAIYDLKTGNVYSVDEHAVSLLEECEIGLRLEQILKSRPKDIKIASIKYLEELVKSDLAYFVSGDRKITKIEIKRPHPLEFIWLELTVSCNLKCVHCYSSSTPSAVAVEEKMAISDWIRVIKESHKIGCRSIQFIGGEPLTHASQLRKLITVCRLTGYEFIEVYTNATLIKEEDIRFFADNNVAIAVSVYSDRKKIHERITRKHGSFDLTITNLKKLVHKNIQTRVGLTVTRINEDVVEETIEFLRNEVGVNNIKIDVVRPSGRGCNDQLIPVGISREYKIHETKFPKCSLDTFRRAKYGHNCFSKEICITASGDVLPCIMEREIALGNILNAPLENILESEMAKQIRHANKDRIEICRDCEYRYCCFDCRPKARNLKTASNFYAKPADCLYDPYEGK